MRFLAALALFQLLSVVSALAQDAVLFSPELPPTSAAVRKAEAISLLSDYLQYPSLSGEEDRVGQFLADYCKAQGLHITQLPSEEGSMNFAATLYPLEVDKPVIWLQHHMDVVPAAETEGWRHPPFSGRVALDTIWGRGALDNKGMGVMQLMALLNLKESLDTTELVYNVGLLCVSNEEVGGLLGSRLVIDKALTDLKPLVVFGEGGAGLTGVLSRKPDKPVFGISVAEKTVLWLKLDLQLNSYGHGAAPAPEYANKLMIHALSRLEGRKLDFEFNRVNKRMFRRMGRAEGGIRGFVISHLNWAIFRPFIKGTIQRDPMLQALTTNTVTVTKLENSPGPHNQISSTATAYLDCRLQPNTAPKAFIRKLERLLDQPRISISVVNQTPQARPSPTNDFTMPWPKPFRKTCRPLR
ncbi:Succinyl-diaminopimelate desuccinylase [Cesiribacter andamanensis AMV16]|uniref:Succinyl-diaminopimelate desuccinylase n=2 Tax=Cesiribacter TaxID=1133570 RepID=M7MY59_9BACT|nr:Succinyl-diaminopimelate desuccinylase [Cesiribacter andamanensis AMV16]